MIDLHYPVADVNLSDYLLGSPSVPNEELLQIHIYAVLVSVFQEVGKLVKNLTPSYFKSKEDLASHWKYCFSSCTKMLLFQDVAVS